MVAERQALIERVRALREEIRAHFAGIEHWNKTQRMPGETPIDPDPDGTLTRMAESLDATLAKERR